MILIHSNAVIGYQSLEISSYIDREFYLAVFQIGFFIERTITRQTGNQRFGKPLAVVEDIDELCDYRVGLRLTGHDNMRAIIAGSNWLSRLRRIRRISVWLLRCSFAVGCCFSLGNFSYCGIRLHDVTTAV